MKVISEETGIISKEKKVSKANPVIKIGRPVISLYFNYFGKIILNAVRSCDIIIFH
jgi:hypothetical protein